jgi:ectoine hydroxylase-related dioxygenase (phytanoyl-CoA dioxygenase family)
MSLPDITRHMGNAWKSDRTVARVALSAAVGEIVATLSGWAGARLALDTIWWKTPGAKEIALHQDGTYMSTLDPPETTTCWIALDDTSAEARHDRVRAGLARWPLKPARSAPFTRRRTTTAARCARRRPPPASADPQVVPIEVPAGGCVVHHGRTWHGSGRNRTAAQVRRSLAVHLLPAHARFRREGSGYIFGRYQRVGDTTMDESFFPILWTRDGHRTAFLAAY